VEDRDDACGHSTAAMASTIKTMAAVSCQCKTSSNQNAPLNTPNTGMNMTLKVDAKGGRLRANESHAVCANTKIPSAL